MRARGLDSSVTTFGTLISVAADAGAHPRVREAWSALQQSGLPVHITCVNAYLAAVIKEVGGSCSGVCVCVLCVCLCVCGRVGMPVGV